MRIRENDVTNFQINFLKQLMGEPHMSDVRFVTRLLTLCDGSGVDISALLKAVENREGVTKNDSSTTNA